MNNLIEREVRLEEPKHENSVAGEPSDKTNMCIADPDTMLGMSVLLIACLALALLAHIVV